MRRCYLLLCIEGIELRGHGVGGVAIVLVLSLCGTTQLFSVNWSGVKVSPNDSILLCSAVSAILIASGCPGINISLSEEMVFKYTLLLNLPVIDNAHGGGRRSFRFSSESWRVYL